ncbi:MAG TPA: hypothetical protein PLO93_02325 [Candidatus Omnitrophota bacterium]|nr:hypothetical protein [Candidatus Omnitrophota bacterium]HQL41110.1 hypothetical protein [Candidatus Omnitrophota bacterium]
MKPRERKFFTTPLCFLLCFLFAGSLFFIVQYLEASCAWTRKSIDLLQANKKRLEDQMQQFDSLMAEHQKDIKRFESLLFTEKDIAAFLEGISVSSKQYNVKPKEMTALQAEIVKVKDPLAPKDVRPTSSRDAQADEGLYLMATPYKLRVSGETENVFDFMTSLEKNRQLLTLSDFLVSGRMYPEIQVEFRLDLYSLGGLDRGQAAK